MLNEELSDLKVRDYCRDNGKAAHSAEHFAKEARQFAETDARKRAR